MRRSLSLACLLPLLLACSGSAESTSQPIPAPDRTGWGSDTPYEGFLLVTPLKSQDVFLLDMQGETVHSWETEWEPGNSVYLTDRGTIYRAMRIEEDVEFQGGGIGGGIQEIAADGTILWEYRMADGNRHAHHDFDIMPNGNILLLAWVKHSRNEALARGRDPELLRGEEFWPDSVFEIRPFGTDGGEIVWEWHAWDHLIQDFDADAEGFGVVADHPERIDINGDRDPELMSPEAMDAQMDHLAAMGYAGGDDPQDPPPPPSQDGHDGPDDPDADKDAPLTDKQKRRNKYRDADWMHTNAIDYHPGLDLIVISVRRFDEAWVIDHSTTTAEAASSTGGQQQRGGDLVYRWGNPAAYSMGSLEDRILVGQHDVQWIEEGLPGAGGFLAFNNGNGRHGGDWSSIEEWWPAQNADGLYLREDGQRFGPEQSNWKYEAETPEDFYSSFISGVQRLPNGNTLVCSGADGLVFEVHPSGKVIWEWSCDVVPEPEEKEEGKSPVKTNSLFRATRLAPDHPGLQALREQGVPIPATP